MCGDPENIVIGRCKKKKKKKLDELTSSAWEDILQPLIGHADTFNLPVGFL